MWFVGEAIAKRIQIFFGEGANGFEFFLFLFIHHSVFCHLWWITPGPHLVQFLVDPSVLSLIITLLGQVHREETIFSISYITHTYYYCTHQSRL